MKVRNYEKYHLLVMISFIIVVVEILFFMIVLTRKVFSYKKMSGVVVGDEKILVIVDKKDRDILYKNRKIYYRDKKISYEIEEDRGVLLKKDGNNYYEMYLKIVLPKNKKYNDVFEFSIQEEKKKIMKLIKIIWEGD